MTTFNTLGYSWSPCAEVLSVAGFSALCALFPLGFGFILRQDSLLVSCGVGALSDINLSSSPRPGITLLVQHPSLYRVSLSF